MPIDFDYLWRIISVLKSIKDLFMLRIRIPCSSYEYVVLLLGQVYSISILEFYLWKINPLLLMLV